MSAEARYFRVGLFVLAGAVLTASCAVILGGRDLFAERVLIETYFDESVQGLDVGSALNLRGVRIGEVAEIGFVSERYRFATREDQLTYGQRIRVVLDVTPRITDITEAERRRNVEEMIERGLRTRLTTSGLTGTSFIQADFLDPEQYRPMEIAWTPEHLYVPSAPSLLATISTAAERIFQRLEETQIEEVVADLDELLVTIRSKIEGIDIEGFEGEATKLVADLRGTVDQLRADFRDADVPGLADSARQALDRLDGAVARAERVLEGGKYDAEVTLENVRVASENLRDLTETLRSQPSLLIRGEAPERTPVSP